MTKIVLIVMKVLLYIKKIVLKQSQSKNTHNLKRKFDSHVKNHAKLVKDQGNVNHVQKKMSCIKVNVKDVVQKNILIMKENVTHMIKNVYYVLIVKIVIDAQKENTFININAWKKVQTNIKKQEMESESL